MPSGLDQADVIVVGAGATGMSATRVLAAHGLDVHILEARKRIGGRILTIDQPSLPYAVELGAEFVQGTSPYVMDIAAAAGLPIVEMQGSRWQARDGRLEPHPRCGPDISTHAARYISKLSADRSLQDFADAFLSCDERAADREAVLSRVRDYDAAYPERISIKALVRQWDAEERIQGDRPFRIVGGYVGLMRWMRGCLPQERAVVHLGSVVDSVDWHRGAAQVVAQGRTLRAPRVIITVPLGVLRAAPGSPGAIRFRPTLPGLRDAVQRLHMGNVMKLILQLKTRVWDDALSSHERRRGNLARVGFLHAHDEPFHTWWTANPFYAPVLTAWAAGPSADQLAGLQAEQLVDRAIESAARIFRMNRAQFEESLTGWHYHDWTSDPFSRGAYSYIGLDGMRAQEELVRPVEATLFFAGEALDQHGHHAMVHGALAEGERVANAVLASIGLTR